MLEPSGLTLPDIGYRVGLPGLDLDGQPLAVALGHNVDGLAVTDVGLAAPAPPEDGEVLDELAPFRLDWPSTLSE